MKPKTYSRSEIAQLLEVTPQRVGQWVTLGCPSLPDGKRFRLSAVVEWRITRAEELSRGSTSAGTPLNRKLDFEAQIKELQLEQMRGSLVPVDDHEEIIGRIAGGFSAVASGRLARFERDIVQATTPGGARKVTQAIHMALMEGAQDLAQKLEDEAEQAAEQEEREASARTTTARARRKTTYAEESEPWR